MGSNMCMVVGSKQWKDKVFMLKMLVDFGGSGVNLVRRMKYGEDIKNSWIMYDHVKRL